MYLVRIFYVSLMFVSCIFSTNEMYHVYLHDTFHVYYQGTQNECIIYQDTFLLYHAQLWVYIYMNNITNNLSLVYYHNIIFYFIFIILLFIKFLPHCLSSLLSFQYHQYNMRDMAIGYLFDNRYYPFNVLLWVNIWNVNRWNINDIWREILKLIMNFFVSM